MTHGTCAADESEEAGHAKPKPSCVVEGCPRRVVSTNEHGRVCGLHRRRWLDYGSFDLPPRPKRASKPKRRSGPFGGVSGAQWLTSLPSGWVDECIIWPGARNEKGYGLISDRLSTGERRAHRAACRIFHGPPPDGRPHALHLCGKGHEGCVTPSHLYWGTPAMNSADAVAHGTIVSGSDNNFAILTEADINPIRRDQRPVPEIAERYGVTKWAIYDIKNGRNWKHVPWE